MASITGEFGTQPGVPDLKSQNFTGHTGTQCHHIGVVVQTGQLCGLNIAQQRAADALDLVGSDGNADAGGAKDDAAVTFTACNCFCGSGGKNGIVTGIQSMGS